MKKKGRGVRGPHQGLLVLRAVRGSAAQDAAIGAPPRREAAHGHCFFQAEDGIRDKATWLEFRRVLFRSVLEVRDTGVGMSEELRARAFELFVQGDAALDRGKGGLGIGLTLVRRLAELHGGAASAASDGPGQGASFSVRLPAIDPPAPSPARGIDATPLAARDVLIVEDNADAADTLRRLLELSGHRVRGAHAGVAALEALLSGSTQIALIDIGLPRMDGYELARRLRASLNGRPCPFMVAVTGYGLPGDRRRAGGAGFDEPLAKPIDAAALARVLAHSVL